MIRLLLIMMSAIMIEAQTLQDHKIAPDYVKDGDYMGIKILDSKVVTVDAVDGLGFAEISDIAYDSKQDIFYALSDRARLFRLSIMIEDKKIKSLKALSGKKLKNLHDKKLLKSYQDSEGLALVDGSLLISFERKPRVTRYDAAIKAQENITLPKVLQNIYHYRGKNAALEALTYSKAQGIITAGEYPLKRAKTGYHDIYTGAGKLCAIPHTHPKNAITEMEMLPDGNLLVLQRKFELMRASLETTLVKVHLDKQTEGVCKSEILVWMSTEEGWDIDNYEGLTHIRDNLYMMVSDNNNNSFQKTLFTLFEIKE